MVLASTLPVFPQKLAHYIVTQTTMGNFVPIAVCGVICVAAVVAVVVSIKMEKRNEEK